jgi:hypothetical protein
MTDLTEQWKKGELKEGKEYWVILTDEWYSRNPVEPVRAFYSCECEFEGYLDDDIKEVLAPVPSYKEWQETLQALDAAHKAIKMEDETINRLVCSGKQCNYEKRKLKELLKEWAQFEIEENPNDFTVISERMSELANKTKQVLGEDK